MSDDPMTVLPELLCDEAAFALSEALHWLALACDWARFDAPVELTPLDRLRYTLFRPLLR